MQTQASKGQDSSSFYYGWLVLGISFITTLVGAGIRSSPAVFIHPFEAEFGWSPAAITSAVGINLLLFGVPAPIHGLPPRPLWPRRGMLICPSLLCRGG